MNEKQKEYWTKRNEKQFLAGEKKGLQLAKELKQNYDSTITSIENQLNIFYSKYATKEGISSADARKLLTRDELKSFKKNLNNIIDYATKNKLDKDYKKKMKLLNIKLKVSRLEELKIQINYELAKLSVDNQEELNKYLSETYTDEYYKTIYNVNKDLGIATSFSKLSNDMVSKAIATKYDIGNYSVGEDKLWKNSENLMTILEQKIPQGIALGYNPNKLAGIVKKELGTNYNASVRLIRTEYNAIMNDATSQGYKACGIDRYQILATLDSRTSEICQEMDSKIFYLDKKEVGINYPPFHPNCRTTTIPYFEPDEIDEEFGIGIRISKDNDGNYIEVPSNMTYKEWYKKYVE